MVRNRDKNKDGRMVCMECYKRQLQIIDLKSELAQVNRKKSWKITCRWNRA
jgi:hypothetical protein